MYVCPCIIYENDERYQLDAKILFIIINNCTCFGHLYAHLQEYKLYTPQDLSHNTQVSTISSPLAPTPIHLQHTLQPPFNGLHIPPQYLHYTYTTITATIHCRPPLHPCISAHSSEHNTYYVPPAPNTTYSITLTNNYTTQRTT